MMKKVFVGVLIAGVLVAAFATVGLVSAQATGQQGVQGDAPFGMGRRGGMAFHQSVAPAGSEVLHDYMVAAFAEKLGVSVEVLEERLANGEHVGTIAFEQGLTVEEFQALMVDVRAQAVDQAVADGVLTQEQADWMKARSGGMRGGMRGGMYGGFGGNFSDCPMYDQAVQ
jgi:hypothetical protein